MSWYESEQVLSKRDLVNLLNAVVEIRKLHDNGAAAHFGYIASLGSGNRYEVGTLVIDAVEDTMLVFHRQTEEGITQSKGVLYERITRGY